MPDIGLIAAILGVTFLFDLADIRPQVNSFGFVVSGLYLVYLSFRVLLSLVAAIVIGQARPDISPLVLGFVSALAGVVVLQNFAVNVAGTEVFDLATLVKAYKLKIVAEDGPRTAAALRGHSLRLSRRLAVELTPDRLRQELQAVLFQVFVASGDQNAAASVGDLMRAIDEQCGPDEEFRRRVHAAQIAETSPQYAEELLFGKK